MPTLADFKLAGIIVGVLLIFSAGFELRVLIDHSNERAQLVADAAAKAAAQKKADDASTDWEKQLGTLRDANKKLRGRLQNEVSKAAYSACTVPDDGVRIFNDAIGHPSGKPDGSMLAP